MISSLIVLIYLFVVTLSDEQVNTESDEQIPLIIDGTDTTYEQYPFMAAITNNNKFWCGGSIIRKEYPAMILTAAHCVVPSEDLNQKNLGVQLGLNYENGVIDNINTYNFAVKDVRYHNEYVVSGDNDIAVIWIEADISKNDRFKAIDISSSEPSEGQIVRLVGYGSDAFICAPGVQGCSIDINPRLQYADLTYHSWDKCYYESGNDPYFTTNQFCTFDFTSNACHGDSGGPLLQYFSDGSCNQFGIVHGPHNGGDCRGYDRNTIAGKYISWINQQKKQIL